MTLARRPRRRRWGRRRRAQRGGGGRRRWQRGRHWRRGRRRRHRLAGRARPAAVAAQPVVNHLRWRKHAGVGKASPLVDAVPMPTVANFYLIRIERTRLDLRFKLCTPQVAAVEPPVVWWLHVVAEVRAWRWCRWRQRRRQCRWAARARAARECAVAVVELAIETQSAVLRIVTLPFASVLHPCVRRRYVGAPEAIDARWRRRRTRRLKLADRRTDAYLALWRERPVRNRPLEERLILIEVEAAAQHTKHRIVMISVEGSNGCFETLWYALAVYALVADAPSRWRVRRRAVGAALRAIEGVGAFLHPDS